MSSGYYQNLLEHSYFHMNVGDTGISRGTFIFTVIHELGHALGLGENLADLLALSFWVGSELELDFILKPVISYHPAFFQTLYQRLESQGRTDDFWRAAFHSYHAFDTLWQEVMLTDFIDLEELLLAKSLEALALIAHMATVAHNHMLEPYPVVLDFVLTSHLFRYVN